MAKDDGKVYWKQDRWNGGESEDSRIGNLGAGRYLLGCDIQSDSGLLGVARKPTRHDPALTFADLIKWIVVNPANNDVYYYAGDKIVKESGGSYSAAKTIASGDSAAGQGLGIHDGYLYAFSATKIHRFDLNATWVDNHQTGLTSATFHPTCNLKNLMLFGHGRYVGTIDDTQAINLTRLTLPPDYVVRSIFRAGSYAAILALKGTAISDSEEGMLFLWNGTSQNYDDFIPLDGNPHAGIALKNKMTIIAGLEPSIQESLGGMAEIQQVIPNIGDGKTCEVWPGAIDTYRRMVYFGISDGTSTGVLRAVRAWGSKNTKFPSALNPEFPISTGNVTGTTRQITAVKKVGTTLRFAWKDGSTYGVDAVDMTAYQTEAIFRTLAFDNRSPYEKTANRVMVELAGALATDEYVTAKISGDPYGDAAFAGDIVSKQITYAADGAVKLLELPLVNETVQIRSRDIHIELRPGGTGSTRPRIKRMWLDFDEDQDQL